MRTALNKIPLLLVALAMLGLTACDQSEEAFPVNSGDNLVIRETGNAQNDDPLDDGLAPGSDYFFVQAHNSAWDYEWNVAPSVPSEVLQDGQFFRIDYEEPGDYTVTVSTVIEGESHDDTLSVTVAAPTAAGQIGRLPRFGALNTALGASSIAIPDSGVTVLAPTSDALIPQFDANEDGALDAEELPADSVLTDILETHVIPQTLSPDDIQGGETYTTLEGEEVTFQGSGDNLSVVVEDDTGTIIAEAPVTLADLSIDNGAVYPIGGVLAPGSASVQFDDQTSDDGVTVSVASVYIPRDGYVAIHDSTLLDDPPQVQGSVIGVSDYLEAGVHNDVEVTLFDVPGAVENGNFEEGAVLEGDQLLVAMPHEETNGNQAYNFITSDGMEDDPYTEGGSAVVDPGFVTVAEEME